MKLIVIRHGETADNRRGILRGSPEKGLTNKGSEQAKKAAVQLKNERIDMIYSSDLQRCKETLAFIRKYHSKIPYEFTKKLRELDAGKTSRIPLWFPRGLVRPILGLALRLNLHTPGGESWRGLQKRIKDYLNELYKRDPEATLLFVTHGITIQAMRNVLAPLDNKKLGNVPSNGSITRFTMNQRIKD